MSEEQGTASPESLADGLRAEGWAVAVHNDYRLKGERFTFWLFTREGSVKGTGEAIWGEGRTDQEALTQVRERQQALLEAGQAVGSAEVPAEQGIPFSGEAR